MYDVLYNKIFKPEITVSQKNKTKMLDKYVVSWISQSTAKGTAHNSVSYTAVVLYQSLVVTPR